jgi:hypothetical protein
MNQPGRCDVVIKTWYNDLCWLSYCLRFLELNWREPDSQIIVLANDDCRKVIETWRFGPQFQYFFLEPWPDGNQFECYLTLLLDDFSDAEFFAIFDSDTMLERPMRLSDKMENGKPIIYYTPEEDLETTDVGRMARKLWFPLMEHWLDEKPVADFMVQFPFVYRADSIRAVRRLITAKTKRGLRDSLYSDTKFDPKKFADHPFKFSEHNVIGFHCYLNETDQYIFKPLGPETPNPVKIYHSWTQWNQDTQLELDTNLGLNDYFCSTSLPD